MEAYTDFAAVYDTFMDDTPYEQWAELLDGLIRKYGVSRPGKETRDNSDSCQEEGDHDRKKRLDSERDLVLDLGCGTGTLTELLCRKGYDMIGVDSSCEMLRIAVEKRDRSNCSILYLCQDMRELDLYSTVGTVISVCDSLNYLLEADEVVQVFELVNNYLYPGGIFIFDFNTAYKYEQVIGDTTIAENRQDCSFIWENFYDSKERINEYDLTFFVREPGKQTFRRFSEVHFQRGYTLHEMESFLSKAGMELVAALDAETHKAPTDHSERIYMVAREKGKQTEFHSGPGKE